MKLQEFFDIKKGQKVYYHGPGKIKKIVGKRGSMSDPFGVIVSFKGFRSNIKVTEQEEEKIVDMKLVD